MDIIDYDVLRTAYKKYELGTAEEEDACLIVKTKDFDEYTDNGGLLRISEAYWFVKWRLPARSKCEEVNRKPEEVE